MFPYTMQLFTWNTSFSLGDKTLKTNATNFLEQAESALFINKRWMFKMVHEETNYTSSKCFIYD